VVHVATGDSGETEISRLRDKVRDWLDPIVAPWSEFRELVSRGNDAAHHILEWAAKIGAGYLFVGAHMRAASLPVLSVMHTEARADINSGEPFAVISH